MEAWYGVVERVMKRIEDRIPSVLIQERIHVWNPRGCDLDVEEQVVRDRQSIDQQIVERDFVGHVSVAREGEVYRGHINQEQVDKEVVEIEEFRQEVVSKHILEPLCEFPFYAVDPRRPVPRLGFHGFVQFVRDGFPADDDDVAHRVEVVPFVVDFLGPRAPGNPVFRLPPGEEPTDDWREDHDHAHHDLIGVHGTLAMNRRFMHSGRTTCCEQFSQGLLEGQTLRKRPEKALLWRGRRLGNNPPKTPSKAFSMPFNCSTGLNLMSESRPMTD